MFHIKGNFVSSIRINSNNNHWTIFAEKWYNFFAWQRFMLNKYFDNCHVFTERGYHMYVYSHLGGAFLLRQVLIVLWNTLSGQKSFGQYRSLKSKIIRIFIAPNIIRRVMQKHDPHRIYLFHSNSIVPLWWDKKPKIFSGRAGGGQFLG